MFASKQFRVTLGLCILCVIVIAYVHPLISAYADTTEATLTANPTTTETPTPVPDIPTAQPAATGEPTAAVVPSPTASPTPSATIPPTDSPTLVPEASPNAEILTIEATLEPSLTATVMLSATNSPVESATLVLEVSSGAEIATVETTLAPSPTTILMPSTTHLPAMPDMAAGEATPSAEVTAVESTLPGATLLPADVSMTPAAAEATGEVSATPVDMLPPTVMTTPSVPSIILVPNEAQVFAGAPLMLTVFADEMESIYGIVLICQVDPAMLMGVASADGELLPSEQVTTLDGGFEADGRWTLAATYDDMAAAGLQGTGILWQLDYHAAAPGLAHIQCQAQMSDRSGYPLPPVMAETILVIEDTTAEAMTPTATETLTLEPTSVTATIPPTPSVTPSSSPEEMAEAIPDNVGVDLVAQNYGLTVPPADPSLDLNGDGIININDLVLVSARDGNG